MTLPKFSGAHSAWLGMRSLQQGIHYRNASQWKMTGLCPVGVCLFWSLWSWPDYKSGRDVRILACRKFLIEGNIITRFQNITEITASFRISFQMKPPPNRRPFHCLNWTYKPASKWSRGFKRCTREILISIKFQISLENFIRNVGSCFFYPPDQVYSQKTLSTIDAKERYLWSFN